MPTENRTEDNFLNTTSSDARTTSMDFRNSGVKLTSKRRNNNNARRGIPNLYVIICFLLEIIYFSNIFVYAEESCGFLVYDNSHLRQPFAEKNPIYLRGKFRGEAIAYYCLRSHTLLHCF